MRLKALKECCKDRQINYNADTKVGLFKLTISSLDRDYYIVKVVWINQMEKASSYKQ